MQEGGDPRSSDGKITQQVTLVPTLDASALKAKSARSGRNTMLIGCGLVVLGVVLTALASGETLYWGAIVFGGMAFIYGLIKYLRAA